jgi:pyruvate/2-oxoglutarate dehydrogenase complex dihydrolipoamide acyltransferase (E2) component
MDCGSTNHSARRLPNRYAFPPKALSMHRSHAIALSLLLTAGCAVKAPDESVAPKPEVAATQPAAPPSTAGSSVPAASQPASAPKPPPAAPTPALQAESKAGASGAKPPIATKPPTAPRAKPPASLTTTPPALDLNALKAQLKETSAIGAFTKLTLKNQVDDLLQQFRDYYAGRSKLTMAQLRRSYDLLLMKVLSLLQDDDPKLASAIVSSREAIWGLLADPKKFAALEV